uniref:Uncharacterized protein n=1 Tax=Sphaerodactylus townsendi TaxID=933632 RepID=A0ACB8EJ22_9SAUR
MDRDNILGSITCEKPIRDPTTLQSYSVSCKKERPCPGVEEYQPTEMVLEVFDKNQYENDTVSFFIKDIIKPDVTACEIVCNGTACQVIWKPPQTWSTPLSYFGLKYRIKTIGASEKIYEVDNPIQLENGNRLGCSFKIKKNKIYYIQSRDRYNEKSAWSEWSKPCSVVSQKEWPRPSHSPFQNKHSPMQIQKDLS